MFIGLILYLLTHREPLHGTVYLNDVGVAKWGPDGPRNNWIISREALPPLAKPALRADFNGDGIVNSQDFFDFLAAWQEESNNGTVNP